MEDPAVISNLCKTLASFCNHIQSSTEALKQSIQRRPIPLESASQTFLQHLNRRVSSASNDLNLLESMAFGTVSFGELLGYCNELYDKNQSDLVEIENRFKEFGYVPEPEVEEEEEQEEDEVLGLKTPDSKFINSKDELGLNSVSCGRSSLMQRLDRDPLLNESLSLRNLGLSDVCLATLASKADNEIANYDSDNSFRKEAEYSHAIKVSNETGEDSVDNSKSCAAPTTVISISRDDYDNLPSFMKSLASWEDLTEAVDKLNSILCNQKNSEECNFFHQDKLTSFGLGPKVRSYLLMLVRMHRLIVETIDGSIVYRVL